MNLLDKVIAQVQAGPSDMEIAAARAALRASGVGDDWVVQVCDHHDRIDAAFAAVRGATTAEAQRAAQRRLADLLSGHALAEEATLYPAMGHGDQKSHAAVAYAQQNEAKLEVAALDNLAPLSDEYIDALGNLNAAVVQHVHEEETTWFPKLRESGDLAMHSELSARYRAQAELHLGAGTLP